MKAEVQELQDAMRALGYIAEPSIATAVYLAKAMPKPLLIEGAAGVGKTEIAKVLAQHMDTELIRLQCYEGLDVNTSLYEWNYQKQLLRLRIASEQPEPRRQAARNKQPEQREQGAHLEEIIFGRDYLLERPLLRAITRPDAAPVLLIDEIDRADEGFEAFLLELLSDFQVTIPELGTISATHRPFVVLTSNRTRELGDALRRRCLYLYIEHPSLDKEIEILRTKVPEADEHLAMQIAAFMRELRKRRLMKPPGISETLDWARALTTLHRDRIDPQLADETLGCVLKDRHDIEELRGEALETIVAAAVATATAV
jgi:MoxR-like ATPase